MILEFITGLAGGFLPEIVKFANRWQDNKHELAMMDLRIKADEKTHMYKMEEIGAQADISETIEIHKPATSFGVQMLDAAKDSNLKGWAIVPAFYMFTFLDWFNGMVRPTIAYWAFGFYVAYKYACYDAMRSVSDESFKWTEGIINLWTPNDWSVLILVLSFFFGQRMAKAAFGGSASTGKPGA